ncbi:TIGR01244 family sulfur transferase [Dokdonella sp.]|uniref:TIGR01244 family sulfur transferase n=1 Tax=Dokdonella sp. TaxID=2291710 RepID=UPI001B0C8309|nr:TIGR01244 family sulfur transferase [Dokdonella sp.]MBO9663291.1 TIGR01244 family phosphatase [Dokdonella sp.]
MSKLKWMFAQVVLLAAIGLAMPAGAADAPAAASVRPLVGGVWISGQISPDQIEELKAQGIKAIVDLRPDGEAPEQPPSSAVDAAARSAGLAFSYAPVAGSDIPAAAVDAVSRAIARPDNAVLLYCKSGRRAARTWALAEASRFGGLEAEAIEAVVTSAGQSVDDLKEQIAARVATRPKLP